MWRLNHLCSRSLESSSADLQMPHRKYAHEISSRGFWGDRFRRSLFDVRVFHPNVPSAIQAPLVNQYAKHERSKRREYDQRVCDVGGASFVLLVLSSTGGMGPACTTTFKRLASLTARTPPCWTGYDAESRSRFFGQWRHCEGRGVACICQQFNLCSHWLRVDCQNLDDSMDMTVQFSRSSILPVS